MGEAKAAPASVVTALLIVSILLGACGSVQPTEPPAATTERDQPPHDESPTVPSAEPEPVDTQELPSPSAEAPIQPTEPAPTVTTMVPTSPAATAGPRLTFASFEEPVVQVQLAASHEPIAPDLGNVHSAFVLSEAQKERLARDGFVVSPGTEKEFFTLYEEARYANVPIFVTSDSLLHAYHLLFDKVLRTAEVEHFVPLLRDLNQALLVRAQDEHEVLKGTDWEDAARRTVAFVGVASKLLDPTVVIPDYAADLVDAELTLIREASDILSSPVFPGLEFGEDYTQYIPRGHYTQREDLEAYFRSMMWYGRMTFRLKTENPDVGRGETRSALLLVHALRTADVAYRPAIELWADLYNPTVFFVGRSDDLTVLQYADLMDSLYGPDVTVTGLADEDMLDAFIEEANKLPPPRILGMVIADTDDEEQTTKGLRFMGQRFVPDAYIFGQLIYGNVGTPGNRRGLPKGLDLLAAMGSERAYQHLHEMGETAYENYVSQMGGVREWVASLTTEDWTETLNNTWLYCFQPLLEEPGAGSSGNRADGYPAFMQSPAWLDKQLQTVLGSWTELKHDTILYAKQAYSAAGAGPMPPKPVPPRGYVEPVPRFFARLAALTAMTHEGLSSRGLLVERDDYSLQRLEELARSFQTMAEKELRGEMLTDGEYATIRFYGGELEHLTMAAADMPEEEQGDYSYMDEEPQAAVIADVATDPFPVPIVLEEAVGRIDEIHVVVPVPASDGTTTLQVAKGGVFSYYEFSWPASDRLTDEAWREMLETGEEPPRPAWIESFYASDGEYSDLTGAIFRYQESVMEAHWMLEAAYLQAGEELQDQVQVGLDALRAAGRYEGRQLVRSDVRSFDRQSATKAVVTVRETWQDWLYEIEDYAGEGGEALAQRGPYALDVTYTLEPGDWGWIVTQAVYANEPPSW